MTPTTFFGLAALEALFLGFLFLLALRNGRRWKYVEAMALFLVVKNVALGIWMGVR